MAGIDTLNPKHEEYIKQLTFLLQREGFAVDNWGLEHTAKYASEAGIKNDFSLPALELRTGFDLLVSYPKNQFYCEVDGKTTMFRTDTGNAAIEVWPVCFGRISKRPRLLTFECAESTGLWLDRLDKEWFSHYFMPSRWDTIEAMSFSRNIQSLLSDLNLKLYEKSVKWNISKASGDPFYLWPIEKIKKQGNYFVEAIKLRAGIIKPPFEEKQINLL